MAWTGGSGVAFVHPRLTNRGRACISRILSTAGWKEEQFWVCRPEDVPSNARALVAMGDLAQFELTGWQGGKRATKYTRGYELSSWTGRPVVPTFDPEQVVQGQWKLLSLMMHDVGVAMGAAMGRGGVVHDPKALVDYKEGVGALRELVAAAKATPSALIAFDLETRGSEEEDEDETIEYSRDEEDESEGEGPTDSDIGGDSSGLGSKSGGSFSRNALDIGKASITTVQFSLAPGTGVSAEWSPTVRELSCELMRLPNPVAGHNSWLFDRPILLNHDVPVPVETDDTMWMFHHMQPDLPAHLQGVASIVRFPFPWKHMAGSDLQFYGAADVDAVQWIMRGLPRDMKRLGLWNCYLRYVRAFRPILEDMEKRGIPVSREKLAELREWLKVEIEKMDERLQVAVPREICLPEKKEPYKGIPNDAKAAIKLAHPAIAGLAKAKQGAALKALTLDDPIVRQCIEARGYGVRDGAVWKEDKLPFNPRSPLQILSYMRHQDYPIPKRFKDGKDSTADKELERLEVKTGDEVIKLTRGIRAYSKMGNAYAGKVGKDGQIEGGWYPGPEGRLRATFTFGPATGQLAARNPNVLTTPKRRPELARKFRECIVAPPGHKIIECLVPETKILTKDLHWVPIGDLVIGSELWGFDESPITKPGSGRSGRYLRPSTVLHTSRLTKPCIRITTDKGVVTCSTDHSWLGRRLGKARWIHADNLKIGDSICHFVRPWEYDPSREAGYLAGFMDGEGYVSNGHGTGFGQNIGATLDHVLDTLDTLGWTVRDSTGTKERVIQFAHGSRISKVKKYNLSGEAFQWLRFLGSIRPPRLLSKLDLNDMAYWGKASKPAIILHIEDMGELEVVAVETTTGTFFAEGLLSHNCDMRAFHARTTGLAAESADYMRLADMDIHSFLAGHLVHYPGIETCLGMPDDDLRQYLAGIKKQHKAVRDFKAKPTILGVGFKMGHRRLFFENRDSMTDEREAKHLLDTLKGLFPAVFAWQDAICEEADRKHYLINAWGAIRWFWDVFKWQRVNGDWHRSSSRDAEKVVAYLPSSNAHYMLRDKLLQMEEQGWLERYGLINVIHDAVLFVCPDAFVEECIHNVKQCLEAPVPELAHPTLCPDGFTCGAEASVGADWATMEDCK